MQDRRDLREQVLLVLGLGPWLRRPAQILHDLGLLRRARLHEVDGVVNPPAETNG